MKTNYKSLFSKLLVILVFLGFNFNGNAQQLNGDYTIASTGADYSTISAALNDLDSKGIDGPVTFELTGTFTEHVEIEAISGSSATNTVTFKASNSGATVEYDGSSTTRSVFLIDNASNIVIEGLTIKPLDTRYAYGIHVYQDCENIEILNNHIEYTKTTATGFNDAIGINLSFNKTSTTSATTGTDYAKDVLIKGNRITGSADHGPVVGISVTNFYYYYSNQDPNIRIEDNLISDFYNYGMRFYYAQGIKVKNNEITRPNRDRNTTIYGIYSQYGGRDACEFVGNEIHNLFGGVSSPTSTCFGLRIAYNYGAYSFYSNKQVLVSNNLIHNIQTSGTIYAAYVYYNYNSLAANNTISLVGGNSGSGATYGFYGYSYSVNGNMVEYLNNIVNLNRNSSGNAYGFYNNVANYADFHMYDYNDVFFGANQTGSTYYGFFGGNQNTLNDWKTAGNGDWGKNSMEVNPTLDANFQPGFPLDGKATSLTEVSTDFNGNTRSAAKPDIGAIEFDVNFQLTAFSLASSGQTECGNHQESIKVTVKNASLVTAIGDLPLEYEVSAGSNTEVVKESFAINLAPGASTDLTFTEPYNFNFPGLNTVTATVTQDEITSDNSMSDDLTITSTASGSEMQEGNNFPGYYRLGASGGTLANPDVVVAGREVEYILTPPSKYDNTSYNTSWRLTNVSKTVNGASVSGITLNAPFGSNSAVVKFNAPASLEDDTAYIAYTLTDVNTGCDTLIGRYVYVAVSPKLDFDFDDICLGDILQVDNKTTLSKGNLLYTWKFNDPAVSGTDDVSELIDPIYLYQEFGTHDIDLTATIAEYDKFMFNLTKSIVVTPAPLVDFTSVNACFGNDLTFTNNSALPQGVSGTITYNWSFGDNTSSTMKEPTKQYTTEGTYFVTLEASANGCVSSITKRALQFAKPEVDFVLPTGVCQNTDAMFENTSSISIGNTGYKWTFGDGDISNLDNPMHSYSTFGAKTVKLNAVSEFGCQDSIEKTVNVLQAPITTINMTDPCNLQDVTFTSIGNLPPAPVTSTITWSINGEEKQALNASDANSFSYSQQFPDLGVNEVTLKIASSNGCEATLTDRFNVLLQPSIDFDVTRNTICENDPAIFINRSSVAAGEIQYEWRFGDGNISNESAGEHNYTLNSGENVRNFDVTLVGSIPGGCSDSIVKNIEVLASPKATFTFTKDGRGVSAEADQKGLDSYIWFLGNGDRGTGETLEYEYKRVESGTFELCLTTTNEGGCSDRHCETITIDLVGIDGLELNENLVNIYPNPNNGNFTISTNNGEEIEQVRISDLSGKTIYTGSTNTIDLSNSANGIYLVLVKTASAYTVSKIQIAK